MLAKRYQPDSFENSIYQQWESAGHFQPRMDSTSEPFSIVIPPPNITGNLHMGHALNNMVQDVLIRTKRMQGYDVLWQPGTDHASIATQMVVERQLQEQGLPDRKTMGREDFLKKIWQWRDISGGNITTQLRRLGASCDWTRERFTMDKGFSDGVIKTFVKLYNQGLIYRGKRLLNWDPKMETAISDLEVIPREVKDKIWTFLYPLNEDNTHTISVATTRPETMLGDVAIAVNASDIRYQHLIGKYCIQPITKRKLIIIADEHADPELGTGAVKITPAHDFNDFEVAKRHNLPMIEIFDTKACLNENAPKQYQGLDRFEARKKIIADMDSLGFYAGHEEITHTVPYGERGGVPVEPMMTDQWFVDCESLAKRAIASVQQNKTNFVPTNWEQTFFRWLEDIRPWCISRQLWWGHQIPAWYGPDDTIFVAFDEQEAIEKATLHYNKTVTLRRDDDVLDTWFSSALWPFATQNNSDGSSNFNKFYPTSVLVTGFDIIFFWVARMMMTCLHLSDQEPFHTVYVHALVRDEHGQKMSKSKGNVIDPLSVIDEYGADALRLTLCALAAPGRDIKLSLERVAGYRNFLTKLWNACRFAELNQIHGKKDLPKVLNAPANQWIVARFFSTLEQCNKAFDEYRFHDLANLNYHFVWANFCDWYIEFSKTLLGITGEQNDENIKNETRHVAGFILQNILVLLHPITPFITEKLWQDWAKLDGMLITESWPNSTLKPKELPLADEVDALIAAISQIRSVRASLNVPASSQVDLISSGFKGMAKTLTEKHWQSLSSLARIQHIKEQSTRPKGSASLLIDQQICYLDLSTVIDIDAEIARMQKSINKSQTEVQKIMQKLNNEEFLTKAPEHVVVQIRARYNYEKEELQKLEKAHHNLTTKVFSTK